MSSLAVLADQVSKDFLSLRSERSTIHLLESIYSKKPFCKSYLALDKLSFKIHKGEKVAIIGKNGAGKTTLLKLLAGVFRVTSGKLEVSDNPTAFLKIALGNSRDLSVRETMSLLAAIYGIPYENLEQKVEIALSIAELTEFADTTVKTLSAGQYQRLALSIFFQIDSEFVIFDESLTHLDTSFIKKCQNHFESLSASSKTVILTSHDNIFLRKYCNTAIWLENGMLKRQGDISSVLDAYESSF